MIDHSQLALFAVSAALLAVTPGPGIFYVAARTLAGGRAEGIASSIGTALGGLAHVLAGALGVSALVMASAQLFTALKWIGALYLVWLGLRTIRAAGAAAAVDAADADATASAATSATAATVVTAATATATAARVVAVGVRRAFREGMWVEALNPKTAAFFLAFIPQFVSPALGNVPLQFIVLGLVAVALNTAVDIAVAFAAGSVREGAARRPLRMRRIRQASGGAMMALGVGLLFARRPAG